MKYSEVVDRVANSLQLALLLEVSASPKPGNVHRAADFHETRYEHFLASAVALSSSWRSAAKKGIALSRERIGLSQINLGGIVKKSVMDMKQWQSGGNTSLGTILLLSPMAVAAATVLASEKTFSLNNFRRQIKLVVESTTVKDSIAVYDAIRLANPSGLGKVPELDVNNESSRGIIKKKKTTLYQIFKIASSYDSICAEWTNNYQVTFDLGYPYFEKELQESGDINIAIVHTFLKILSENPDTLIARKVNLRKAKEISLKAKKILELGGLKDKLGTKRLQEFDLELRDADHKFNPGTTADLVTAVIATSILNGYKP